MEKDVDQIVTGLRAEAFQNAYRKDLLLKVENLWATDAKFRYAIRGLVKNSAIKDVRGKKSLVDVELAASILNLGAKLGLTQEEILRCLPEGVEPESIQRALHRKRKKPSQAT
jgi:hypothetical protein